MDSSAVGSLKRVLAFPFRQEGWQGRFVIGSALILASFFIPVLPALFAAGYVLLALRQVIEGQEPSLPEWQDWGRLLGDGFKSWLVSLVYLLPAMLAFVIGFAAYFAATFNLIVATETGAPGAADASVVGILLAMVILFACTAIGMLLLILGWIPLPMALCNLAARERLASAFYLREIAHRIGADPAAYLAAWVVVFGLAGLVYTVGMLGYYTVVLICLLPVLTAPLSFYVLLIGAALFGQLYRETAAALEAAPPAAD